ncbi:MAG TPA: hypothetical protein VGL39_13645 [Jatrophihabitantaceae bacterium]|jgi:hypothetical protein
MPDVYAEPSKVDAAVAEQLGNAMELRARDPQQQAMLTAYLDELAAPDGGRVLEIGCGYVQTGPAGYMLSIVDRGGDVLVSHGRVGPDLAASLSRPRPVAASRTARSSGTSLTRA